MVLDSGRKPERPEKSHIEDAARALGPTLDSNPGLSGCEATESTEPLKKPIFVECLLILLLWVTKQVFK